MSFTLNPYLVAVPREEEAEAEAATAAAAGVYSHDQGSQQRDQEHHHQYPTNHHHPHLRSSYNGLESEQQRARPVSTSQQQQQQQQHPVSAPRGLGIGGAPGLLPSLPYSSLSEVVRDHDVPGPRYRLLERLSGSRSAAGSPSAIGEEAREATIVGGGRGGGSSSSHIRTRSGQARAEEEEEERYPGYAGEDFGSRHGSGVNGGSGSAGSRYRLSPPAPPPLARTTSDSRRIGLRSHDLQPIEVDSSTYSSGRPSASIDFSAAAARSSATPGTNNASSPYAYAYAQSQQQQYQQQPPLRSAAPTPVTSRPLQQQQQSSSRYAVNPYSSSDAAENTYDFSRRNSLLPPPAFGIEDEHYGPSTSNNNLATHRSSAATTPYDDLLLRRRSSLTQYLAQNPPPLANDTASSSSRPGSSSSVGKAHLQNLLNGEPPYASGGPPPKSPLYDHLRPASSSAAAFDQVAYSYQQRPSASNNVASSSYLSPPQPSYYDAPLRASGSRLRIDPPPPSSSALAQEASSYVPWSAAAALSPYDRPPSSSAAASASAFRSHPHSPLDFGHSPTFLSSHKNTYLYDEMPTGSSRHSIGSTATANGGGGGGAMSVVSPGSAGKRPVTRAQAAAAAAAASRGSGGFDDARNLYPAPGSSIGRTSTYRDYSGSMGAPQSTAPLRNSIASPTGYPPPPASVSHQQRSMLGSSVASTTTSGPQTRGKVYRKELFQRNDGKQQSVTIIDDDDEDDDAAYAEGGAYKRKAPAAVNNGSSAVAVGATGKKRRLDVGPPPTNVASGSTAKRSNNQVDHGYATSSKAVAAPDVTLTGSSRNGAASNYLPNANGHTYAVATSQQQKAPMGYPPPTVENPTPWDDKEGHYIVQPNTFFAAKDKYRIIRLLGQGTFGKVVEAKEAFTGRKVAIKIIRAVQKYRDAAAIEIRVLNTLKANDPANHFKCIHLIETFDFRNHICLVSELFGMSVFDFLKTNHYQPFPEAHIQSFAQSLLSSLSFVHGLKLIHTDLKPENILLVQNGHYNINERRAGVKARFILRNPEIRLIDFGSATFENEFHSQVVSTRHYRAPEIILGLGWSFPCDMYSIGCILVEFYTGEALFQTHDNLEHLAMMEVVRGKMPVAIARRAQRTKAEFFNRENRLDYPNAQTSKTSRKYVKQMKKLDAIIQPSNPLRKQFHDLVYRMLAFDPAKRINVHEALNHGYFTIVAPPPPGPL